MEISWGSTLRLFYNLCSLFEEDKSPRISRSFRALIVPENAAMLPLPFLSFDYKLNSFTLIDACMECPTNATLEQEAWYLGFFNRAAGEFLLPTPPHSLARSYSPPDMKQPP